MMVVAGFISGAHKQGRARPQWSAASVDFVGCRPRGVVLPPRRLPPSRSSEFWYEDEEEFDAISDDGIQAKVTFLLASSSSSDDGCSRAAEAVRVSLANIELHGAFAPADDPDVFAEAEMAWEGRGGPPYFLRVRDRLGLAAAAGTDDAAAEAAAREVWSELLSINWRTGEL